MQFDSFSIFSISSAVFNLIAQLCIIKFCYFDNWKKISRTNVLKFEILIAGLSILSFIMFIFRVSPIWNSFSCRAYQLMLMVVFEIQKSLFTLVTYKRFVEVMHIFEENVLTMGRTLFVLIFFTTVFMQASGEIGTLQNLEFNKCQFETSAGLLLASTLLHAFFEMTILYLFVFQFKKIRSIIQEGRLTKETVNRIAYTLAFYSLWNIVLASAHFTRGLDDFVFSLWNFHFTIVLLVTGSPRFKAKVKAQQSEKRELSVELV